MTLAVAEALNPNKPNQTRAKLPGHRELKIEQNPSLVKLVEGF